MLSKFRRSMSAPKQHGKDGLDFSTDTPTKHRTSTFSLLPSERHNLELNFQLLWTTYGNINTCLGVGTQLSDWTELNFLIGPSTETPPPAPILLQPTNQQARYWNLNSLSPLIQTPNATQATPNNANSVELVEFFHTQPEELGVETQPLLRVRACTQWLRKLTFRFIFKEMLCKSSLHKSCSQKTLISCELFISEHHKPMSLHKQELNKGGFKVSRQSLSGSTEHN